jgi:serine phosphatase RsbU (regulator of sigma subunit)
MTMRSQPRSGTGLRLFISSLNEWIVFGLWIAVLAGGSLLSAMEPTGQIKIAGLGTLLILFASLTLTMRTIPLFLAAVVLSVIIVEQTPDQARLSLTGIALLVAASLAAWLQARRRERLGLRQVSAESVLELIRDRLDVQAQIPEIPDGWTLDVARRAADGAAISGDFVATRLTGADGDQVLHLAIVDVSGSGITAGPPALLLSGAVGGLLGAIEPDEFLEATNSYLTRQHWPLGFASASYLRVELRSGRYEIRVAGHPPALHLRVGSSGAPSGWRDSSASGPLLGIVPTLSGSSDADILEPGDVLIVYTDGVVEDRVQDLDAGIGRLKAHAELQAARGDWNGAAAKLLERVPTTHDDDRTVVVIRRNLVPGPAADSAAEGVQAASPSELEPAHTT